MRLPALLRFVPLKLHTKTSLSISIVLVTVFTVIAYFSGMLTGGLSDRQEQEQAQLLAAQVADTIRYHVKRAHRAPEAINESPAESFTPDWGEVREDINDTLIKSTPQLTLVRVFHQAGGGNWEEPVRLPADAGPLPTEEAEAAKWQIKGPQVFSVQARGENRLVSAVAPVISPLDDQGPAQTGTAMVTLTFDETRSVAAHLRRMIWPLMLLAIIAITLIINFLFRYLIYEPIDRLLLTMAKAEAGDLVIEAKPKARDEIGMLTSRFNRMISRIREMTEERNLERHGLKERVREATVEIEGRRKQLEDANLRLFELQRQLTQIERLAAAGQLAAQFAHEVGTPLNLILGHVQVLRAHALDERAIKRLNIIESQIKRITDIVRGVLDSTRRPALRLEYTEINTLLADVCEAAQPALASRGVDLRIEMPERMPEIEADSDRLQQVFINLINNSLDAMPSGGTLFISTSQDDGSLHIELTDTGEGILAEPIELIFAPLFTTKRGRGAGLGLTIVKQIITEHGGTVDVESKVGEGTTFRINLPLDLSRTLSETTDHEGYLMAVEGASDNG